MYQPVYYSGQQTRPLNHVPSPLQLQHSNFQNNLPQVNQFTPVELSYPQTMLPSTMFVSSPYFTPPPSARYLSHQQSFQPQSFQSSRVSSPRSSTSKSRSRAPSNLHATSVTNNSDEYEYKRASPPYLTPLNNSTLSSRAYTSSPFDSLNHNIDQLNLSRTIILKNISHDVSLNELLNEIDFGPIEYCKMFSKPTAKAIKDQDPEVGENLKVCYISFINSKVSILFHLKYKNSSNLNELKKSLKDSKYLKIKFNDKATNNNNNNSNQDFIKLKTLNYIVEYNATRSLLINFSVANDLPKGFNSEARIEEIKSYVATHCGKFGDVEDFKIKIETEEEQEDFRPQGKVLVHFTSIDSAIKCYESYLRRIQHDTEKIVNNSEDKKNTSQNITDARYDLKFNSVNFHTDRCDKTFIEGNTRNISPESSANSSVIYKHIQSFQNIPEEIEINEEIPPVESFDEAASNGNVEPIGNSTQLESFLTSPVLQQPNGLNIIDPISPNSSVAGGAGSVESSIQESDIEEQANENDDNELLEDVPTYDNYSYISATSRFSTSMPQFIPIQHPPPPPPPFNLVGSDLMSLPDISSGSVHYPIQPDPLNVGNRTIYLGNLHPNTTVEEIANNVRAGGLVESINHRPERRVCFITFVDANVAFKFYLNHQVLHQLIVHGYDITVGWAKQHSGPLSHSIGLAVTAGASRNVYIGIKINRNPLMEVEKPKLPDENQLRIDFCKFGLLEQINFYHNKDCGFLNFLNISDAIKLVEIFSSEETLAIATLRKLFKHFESEEVTIAFYKKYSQFKISFAKDRCGNPAKFSYKKKVAGSFGTTYQQYQNSFIASENDSGRNRRGRNNPEDYDEKTRRNEADIYMEQTINEEAAMVFGIISNQEKEKIENESIDEVQELETNGSAEHELVKQVESIDISNEDLNGAILENDEEDTDDEEDEEVSIIISSDDVTFHGESKEPVPHVKKNKGKSGRKNQNRQHIYRNRYTHSDVSIAMGNNSASSSTLSLNSSFMNYNPPQNYVSATRYGNLQHQQQPYYIPQLSRNSSGSNIRKSYSSAGPEYFPMQPPPPPLPPLYYHQPATPNPGSNQKFSEGSASHYNNKNPYFTSGSQVMAQYLAKARNENLFYVPTWLANDVEVDQDQIFEKSPNSRIK
ncbi:RNA-binding protein NAB6 [Spathaspora sp. JA1]|nr:RNA-binding protein NAB6 [Spathaspora sp. JA1]